MNKFSLISGILCSSFVLSSPFYFTSCSNQNVLKVTGGNNHIQGFSTDHDNSYWHVEYNSKKYARTLQWKVIESSMHIDLTFDEKSDGVYLSWENIPTGDYQFYIQATGEIDNENLRFVSDLISLHINPTYSAIGGSCSIISLPNSSDKQGWKAIYEKEDYSSLTSWSIEPANELISINYSEEKGGAIVSWGNLPCGTYYFSVKGLISDKNICVISNKISLQIVEQGKCIGGSTVIESGNDSSDSKAWHFFYDDKDVSEKGEWSIEPKISGIKVKYNESLGGAIVSWDQVDRFEKFNFRVSVHYVNESGGSIYAQSDEITLNLYQKIEITGGNYEITGKPTDKDDSLWKASYLGKDYSNVAAWSVNPKIPGISIVCDKTLSGASLEWKNIAFDYYYFKISCVFETESHRKIYGESKVISLFVEEKNLWGGAPYVNGFSTGGRDKNHWVAQYGGIDYSDKAKWTLTVTPSNDSIKFSSEGHYVYWENIPDDRCQKYECSLCAEFTTEDGKKIALFSGQIIVNIRKDGSDQLNGGHEIINIVAYTDPITREGWDNLAWQATFEGILYTLSDIEASFVVDKTAEKVPYIGTVKIRYDESHSGYNIGWINLQSPYDWYVYLHIKIIPLNIELISPRINLHI